MSALVRARAVRRREQPVAGDRGEHGLHVLGQHRGAARHQRPGARGARRSASAARGDRPLTTSASRRVCREERLHVVEQRRRDVDLLHALLQLGELGGVEARLQCREHVARGDRPAAARARRRGRDSRARCASGSGRAATRAAGTCRPGRRVLRGDDEERIGQLARLALDGDLVLLHRLEQRALRLRRRAVDLVGEHDLREDRARDGTGTARLARRRSTRRGCRRAAGRS